MLIERKEDMLYAKTNGLGINGGSLGDLFDERGPCARGGCAGSSACSRGSSG